MKKLVPLLLLLVLVSAACSALGTAPAVTVNGHEISTDELEEEIDAIRSNEGYVTQLEDSFGAPSQGSGGKGTFDAAFVAQVLALRVYHEVVAEDLKERGIEVEDETLDQMRTEMQRGIDSAFGEGSFEKFPKDYRDLLVRQQALVETAQQAVVDEVGDDDEAFFEANPDEFVEICVSHILVGTQGGKTPAEARADALALRERIEDGEDFAELASTESDDPGSASQGGELGCGSRSSLQFDPTFEQAAFALDEDEVSEPVETQFGSHLIVVTERTMPEFRDVADSVLIVMQEVRERRINEYFVNVICEGDVSVNPRYGTWTSESCDEPTPRLPRIEPPQGPVGAQIDGLEFQL